MPLERAEMPQEARKDRRQRKTMSGELGAAMSQVGAKSAFLASKQSGATSLNMIPNSDQLD